MEIAMRRLVFALVLLASQLVATRAYADVFTFSSDVPLVISHLAPQTSTINVTGVTGSVYRVVVTLKGLVHTKARDLDINVSTPTRGVMLMSDLGDGGNFTGGDLRFSDCATRSIPINGAEDEVIPAGGYRPRNFGWFDNIPGNPPTGSSFSEFLSYGLEDPWTLHVVDEGLGGEGTLAGWSITIYTSQDPELFNTSTVGCESPDFDGDGVTDFAVYREPSGSFLILESSTNEVKTVQLVSPGPGNDDVAIPADYDGDGTTDVGVFRRSTLTWTVKKSFSGEVVQDFGGLPNDQPIPTDFDRDGLTDFAVYRASEALWIWKSSRTGEIRFIQGDIPGVDRPARRP